MPTLATPPRRLSARCRLACIGVLFCNLAFAGAQPPDSPPDKPQPGGRGRAPFEGRRGPGERFGRFRDRQNPPGHHDEEVALPPEMVDWVMEFVKDKFPERHDRLAALRERNPRKFQQLLRRIVPVMREYTIIRERNAELAETLITEYRNQQQLDELSRAYRDAAKEPEKQKQIETQMEPLVRKQLEGLRDRVAFRLEDFERRLQDQQQRLAEQRARFEQEKARFEEHVANRLQQIKDGKAGELFEPFGERPRPPGDERGPGGPPRGRFGRRPPPHPEDGPPDRPFGPDDHRPPPPEDDAGDE